MELKEYLQDKTVALVGNATNIKDLSQEIDKHDVVIRLNKGFLGLQGGKLGFKTHILGLSLPIDDLTLKMANIEYLVWLTPKRELTTNYINHNAKFYLLNDWQRLSHVIGSRPSTGCMMLDLLYRIGTYKTLTVYNFDFWKTPNQYTGVIHLGQHVPENEQAYLEALMIMDKKIHWRKNG